MAPTGIVWGKVLVCSPRWRSVASVLAFGGSMLIALGSLWATPALAGSPKETTVSFAYDGLTGAEGAPQLWVVPGKVHEATFRVYGAQGGGAGGKGGEVTATVAVK